MVEDIIMLTMESIFQDRSLYEPGESELLLNYVTENLKKLQDDIYFGNLGKKPVKQLSFYKNFYIKSSCLSDNTCSPQNLNATIGFNENVASMNFDQLITEYIAKSNIFYRETDTVNYFSEQKLYNCEINRNKVKEILKKYENNDIIKYQNLAIPQIMKGLFTMENYLMEEMNNDIKSNYIIFYVLIGVSFTTLLFSLYYVSSIIKKLINKEMLSLYFQIIQHINILQLLVILVLIN